MDKKKLNPNLKRILLILLAIVFLPVWITVWIIENRKITAKDKRTYIIVLWGVFLVALIMVCVGISESRTRKAEQKYEEVAELAENSDGSVEGLSEEEEQAEQTEEEDKTIVTNFGEMEIRQITYDGGVKGEYAVGSAFSGDCTIDKLTVFYNDYVSKNPDLNCFIILYSDLPGKGIYANSYWLQKNVTLSLTEQGDYTVETEDADNYYPEDGALVQHEEE